MWKRHIADEDAIIIIHVLKPTHYAERTRSSTHTTQKWCEENR